MKNLFTAVLITVLFSGMITAQDNNYVPGEIIIMLNKSPESATITNDFAFIGLKKKALLEI